MKWSNPEYNKLYEQGLTETDPAKNQQAWIQANDIVVGDYISIPLIDRKFADGKVNLKIGDPFVATHTHLSLNRGTPERSYGKFSGP